TIVTAVTVIKATYSNHLYKYVLDGFTAEADTSYPGTKDVTVTYGGKTATYQITVKGQPIPDKIKFKAGAGFTRVTGSEFVNPAATGKTAGDLKGAIANATMEVYSGDTAVADSTKLVTGMVVKIFVNGNATDSAIIVIKGDADCDGEISNTDYTLVKAFFKSSAPLDKAALAAADADGNGKLTVSDYIKIRRHNSGTIDLFA
ncbi:MAG: hypothetical protein IJS94_01715, partial [Clostridia bacterium]|nr:hypothetical protein [Clostridia bacterium]